MVQRKDDVPDPESVYFSSRIICEGYQFVYQCPRTFESLSEVSDAEDNVVENVGFCNECNRKVHHCETSQELATHVALGHCVSVPIQSEKPRRRNYVTMGIAIGPYSVTDEMIDNQRELLERLNAGVIGELRAKGFTGSHSALRKQNDGFAEVISIKLNAKSPTFYISFSCIFDELTALRNHSALRATLSSGPYEKDLEGWDSTTRTMKSDLASMRERLNPVFKSLVRAFNNDPDSLLKRPLCEDEEVDSKIRDEQLAWVFRIKDDDSRADQLATRFLKSQVEEGGELWKSSQLYRRGAVTYREFSNRIMDWLDLHHLYTLTDQDRKWLLPPDVVFSLLGETFVQLDSPNE